jgi:hypothetical protein
MAISPGCMQDVRGLPIAWHSIVSELWVAWGKCRVMQKDDAFSGVPHTGKDQLNAMWWVVLEHPACVRVRQWLRQQPMEFSAVGICQHVQQRDNCLYACDDVF